MPPQQLVVHPIKEGVHRATVIMLHGLGDSGRGWLDLAENWHSRNKFGDVKFIFPSAESRPITINGGYRMPGWYDITSFSELNAAHDEAGILETRQYINDLIQEQIDKDKLPSDKIILGGFSQGGAVSIFTGLTTKHKLGGVFGLSCYLLLGDKLADFVKEANDANKDTPFFMGHGDVDEVVKYRWGQKTAEVIRDTYKHQIEFKTYRNLPHSAALEEIDDLENWINKCLTRSESTTDGTSKPASSSI